MAFFLDAGLDYLVQLGFGYLFVPIFVFLPLTLSSIPLCETIVHDLFDLVNHTIEQPLDVHLDLSSQRKTV